jgi:replicative DNA helicase
MPDNPAPTQRRLQQQAARNGHAPPDRLPPHSLEAEQGVLGCLLLAPNEAIPIAVERLGQGADEFYDLRHQVIYRTLTELWDDHTPIDLISAQDRLQTWQRLEEVGGIAYLSSLLDLVPSAANVAYYLDIVAEKSSLRRMVQTCAGIVSRIYDFSGEVEPMLDEAEREVMRCAEQRVTHAAATVRDLVRGAIRGLEERLAHPGEIIGLSTGFVDLDRITNGLRNGHMVTLAARPSVGKTSLAMNIAEHVACDLRLPVGVFSLEMTGIDLVERMLFSRARVSAWSAREGFLAERDYPRITGAAGAIAAAPLHIDDSSGLTIFQLRAKARRMHQQHGLRLLIVDYLQLLRGGSKRYESRQVEVSDISMGIKSLAKELNLPVIAISQLNRQLEQGKGRKPMLSDLRDSGSIEQDSDFVGFLYRPRNAEDDSEPADAEAQAVNLLVAKQRGGPTGEVPLTFLRSYTRFESAARVAEQDVPEDRQRQFPDP